MPPAFNLSQDQTLKFNPICPNSSLLTCWHSIFLLLCKRTCKLHLPSTHTYRLFEFLKINLLFSLIAALFASIREARLCTAYFASSSILFRFLFCRVSHFRESPEPLQNKSKQAFLPRFPNPAAVLLQRRSGTIDVVFGTVNTFGSKFLHCQSDQSVRASVDRG